MYETQLKEIRRQQDFTNTQIKSRVEGRRWVDVQACAPFGLGGSQPPTQAVVVQGYLAHKKQRPPRTLQ